MATIKMTLDSSALDAAQVTEFQCDDDVARELITYYDFGLAALRANAGVHLSQNANDQIKAVNDAISALGKIVEG